MIIGAKYVLRKGKKAVDYPTWKRVLFSILLSKERTIVAVTLRKTASLSTAIGFILIVYEWGDVNNLLLMLLLQAKYKNIKD